jgi:Na+-driven multidrug efflux pump
VVNAYTDDPGVRLVAVGLVGYVALYQFFDALQTVAGHCLRAYRVTFVPMLVQTFCFWGSACWAGLAVLSRTDSARCRGVLAGLGGQPDLRRRTAFAAAAQGTGSLGIDVVIMNFGLIRFLIYVIRSCVQNGITGWGRGIVRLPLIARNSTKRKESA